MNILILSAGTRTKLVEYFVREIGNNGTVVATDMSPLAPAIYAADKHYIVPHISHPDYISTITEICRKESVNGVFSLIDPELSLLAANSEKFAEIGVTVAGSSYELCEKALDKMQMYRFLKDNSFRCAASYSDKAHFDADYKSGKIDFPVFVKPVRGSASTAVTKVYDYETLEFLTSKDANLMIQEYMSGQEIGADVYIDAISGEVVSIFTKKKLLMRAGETDKAVSFKDEKLFALIEDFVKKSGYRYMIDMDIFNVGGEYYISEVNPRFGGGFPHAYECGSNHVRYLINNLRGIKNERVIGQYQSDVYMMKYNEIKILR